ncbi:MAG: ATP-binding protein [Candidatus Limnocylindria bacterium]
MTALELISLINQVLFIGLFMVALRHALRARTRMSVNVALLFGSIAGIVALGRVAELLGLSGQPVITSVTLVLLIAAPYAMLRLVDDFSGTPRWVQVAASVGFVGVSAIAVLGFERMEQLVEIVLIGFFIAVGGFAAWAFALESRRTRGITQRRMTAVAIGAGMFIAAVVLLLLGAIFSAPSIGILVQVLALTAVTAFYLGFVPPAWLRRAWREPDLRGFLERSIHLASVPDDRDAIRQLQEAATNAFGASGAAVGLVDATGTVLRYLRDPGEWVEYPADAFISGRAFQEQRRVVALNAAENDPAHEDAYRQYHARTVIAAPITTEERRIGVLSIFAARAPVFIEDDLWLLELLADQTAVLLEARTVTVHASQLRAREEAAQLKEEFLSAAAHDLRTPLTVVLGQAELLERRLARNPATPVDPAGVERLVREARRLRDLVSELLDAQRLAQGHVIMDRTPDDLCAMVELVLSRHAERGVTIPLARPDEPLIGLLDRPRMEQVLENLIENAMKYGEQPPRIEVSAEGEEARIAVIDTGVGIPTDERGRIFERFFRASNVQSVTDTGLGLGLHICRRIVEEHGGRIWHEPTPGGGSTFVVTLKLEPSMNPAPDSGPMPAWPSTSGTEALADA